VAMRVRSGTMAPPRPPERLFGRASPFNPLGRVFGKSAKASGRCLGKNLPQWLKPPLVFPFADLFVENVEREPRTRRRREGVAGRPCRLLVIPIGEGASMQRTHAKLATCSAVQRRVARQHRF
jgi:hypothetical protein